MPIHLIWGEDHASSENAIDLLVQKIIDPSWISINLSRLDGQDIAQANQAIEESQTPPFGIGGRVIILKRSPFCNGCTNQLAARFESIDKHIPQNTHLILNNSNKPDKRLKTTKLLEALIKTQQAFEQKFPLPSLWDHAGQKELVKRIAISLNLLIDEDAIYYLIESIGNDSNRIHSELKKISLLEEAKLSKKDINLRRVTITKESVKELVSGITTNSLEVGNLLIEKNFAEAIKKIHVLLDQGEPALRIIATLTGQIRGLMWLSVLEDEKKYDINFIAKQAGITNPKRIYIMRKQLKGKSTIFLIDLLKKILEIEASLKKGANPKNSFRDYLVSKS